MTLQEIQELAGHREVSPWIVKLVGDAVAREREECAKVCEELAPLGHKTVFANAAAAIRARGQE